MSYTSKCILGEPRWDEWEAWLSCPVSCGAAWTQLRRRYCSHSKKQHDGRKCIGRATEYRPCNNDTCLGMWYMPARQ